MHRMNHEEWLAALTGGASQRSIADEAGVQQSKISRQLAGGKLAPELVIDLARAYGASPVDALVGTGYLSEADIEGAGIVDALGFATNKQLLEEIRQRHDPEAVRILRGGDGAITPRKPTGGADPKAGRAASAREAKASPTEARRDKAAIGKRITGTADARQRRKN